MNWESKEKMAEVDVDSSRGSLWNRWDPHIHAPGTAMNDQYSGAEPWTEFFERVDNQDPPIRALGITDYFLIDTYEQALQAKASGSMPGVHFLFPNVEIRLSTGTVSSSAINAHLIFSPSDPDHRERIKRLMSSFKFRYMGSPEKTENIVR
jgi:hypothetical protein